jgi:uncharacterized membrane-anchored protein YhcB (DUF1043 family)
MSQNETSQQKQMDWHLLWTALGVVVPLAALIIGCFWSLSTDIRNIDNRLSKLEGSFEERGKWESKHFAVSAE